MDTVRIDVQGTRQVGLRFDNFPDALYEDLRVEIDVLSKELFALVRAATPVASGALLSEERVRLFTDRNRITGYVDVAAKTQQDIRKAAALEYGSRGKPTKVSGHSMRLDHFWANALASPINVMVAAYERVPNIMAQRFERGPLAAIGPQAIARLNAAVERAVAETNA